MAVTEIGLKKNGSLKTLAYFDLFRYPLQFEEIVKFAFQPAEAREVEEELQALLDQNIVRKQDEFYALLNDSDSFESRKQAAAGAKSMWPKAIENGRLIAGFPFVKAVMVSGGLSKQVFREGDDIDYFVICKSNRVWMTKLLLKTYKKLRLQNSKDFFCTNYIIGDSNLEIDEQNLFTAIELCTLQPIGNSQSFEALKSANSWTQNYLPNATWKAPIGDIKSKRKSSEFIERVFNNRFGDWIDKQLMKVIFKRIKLHYKDQLKDVDFNLMFKSKRNVSKIHPSNNQKHILDKYNKQLSKLGI